MGANPDDHAALECGVALIGDLDGDRVRDFLVSRRRTRGDHGVVFALSGRTRRVIHRIVGARTGDGFGTALSGTGDLDRDGVPDLAIGAPFAHPGPWIEGAAPYAGEVHLVSGRSGVVLRTLDGVSLAGPDMARDGRAGGALCESGDLDRDGVADVGVGLSELNGGIGLAVVVSGQSGQVLRRIWGTPTRKKTGYALAGGVDFDRDGVPDLAVGVPAASTSGLRRDGLVDLIAGGTGASLWVATGRDQNSWWGEQFGSRLAVLPDLDGDGVRDLLSAGGYDRGRLLGLSGTTGRVLHEWRPPPDRDYFQDSVVPVSDLDGDRRPELAYARFVGTGRRCDFGYSEVVVLSSAATESGAGSVLWGHQSERQSGSCSLVVGGGEDFDGDGILDLLVGEPGETTLIVTVLSGRSGAVIDRIEGLH